jgi:hypothetical protein
MLVGVLLVGSGLAITATESPDFRGGYVTATTVSEVPDDATVVEVEGTETAESEFLVSVLREAEANGSARASFESGESYRRVTSALPEEALYQGTDGESGFYVRFDGQAIRVNTVEII